MYPNRKLPPPLPGRSQCVHQPAQSSWCGPPQERYAPQVSAIRISKQAQPLAGLIGSQNISGDILWLQWGSIISDRMVAFKIYPDRKPHWKNFRHGFLQYDFSLMECVNVVRIGIFSCAPRDFAVLQVEMMPGCDDMAVAILEESIPCAHI